MTRGRYIALGSVVALLVVGFIGWQTFSDEEQSRATVGEAVDRFREEGGAGEGPSGAELGVYRYDISGSETAEAGLLSATHDYDGIATIIISESDCGVGERWQVLGGRWSEAEFCLPPHGTGLRKLTEFHEFFGDGMEDVYLCKGEEPSEDELRKVGTRFDSRCASDDGVAESKSKVASIEKVTVEGEPIAAVRTVSVVTLTGNVVGSTRREDWRRRTDGLLLRRKIVTEAERKGTIKANYSENFTMDLTTTEPRR